MIVVHQVLFNPSKPLVTAMAPLFFHDDNNSCLEAGQAGSDIKCWRELLILVGGSSKRLWCRANFGLAGLAFKLK
jgi:hypothetical protein